MGPSKISGPTRVGDGARIRVGDSELLVERRRSEDESGRKVIAGDVLAEFASANAATAPKDPLTVASSARNRFAGLVTRVVTDKVMAQVEMQCGPFTVVSLMSADAVRELGLQPGSVAVAVVKATTVIVETPGGQS